MRAFINLCEITTPPERQTVDQVLQAAGYSRIGKGAFGAVYEKPGRRYVLKVFSSKDSAYLDFLDLARKHQNNPHFPKFFGKLVRVNKNYFAIRMEKLTPFNPHQVGESAYALFDYIQDGQDDGDLRAYPELKTACDLVRTKLLSIYKFDHKDGSFMMRGDTIVITDPVLDLAAKDDVKSELPLDPPPERRKGASKKIDYDDDDELLKNLRENAMRYFRGLFESVGDTDAFMAEFHMIQDQDPAFWSSVYLYLLPDRYDIGEVYIDSMGVRNHEEGAGQGKGRHILQTLIELADKYDVTLKLAASNDSPSSHFLEDWYGRHGFFDTDEYSDYGPVMIRKPGGN